MTKAAIAERNRKAKQNGREAEKIALPLLFYFMDENDKIEFINKAFDYLLNDTVPIEVKSCTEWTTDSHNTKKRRRGRFVLDEKQHQQLVEQNGYYLFIVFLETENKKMFKLVKAKDLQFKRLITWAKLPFLIKGGMEWQKEK